VKLNLSYFTFSTSSTVVFAVELSVAFEPAELLLAGDVTLDSISVSFEAAVSFEVELVATGMI